VDTPADTPANTPANSPVSTENAAITPKVRAFGLSMAGVALLLLAIGLLRAGGLLLALLLALMAYWRSRRKMSWSRSKRVDVSTLTLLAVGLAALAVALPHGK
jgi:O-antigen ligase